MARFLVAVLGGLAVSSALAAELRPVDVNTRQWSAVAQVNNNAYGRCTGVLIAPDRVLTAAHCLFNRRTGQFLRAESIHVVLGYDRGRYGFHSVASKLTIGEGYDAHGGSPSPSDYAVLHLINIAPEEFPPLQIARGSNTSGNFIAAGFARGRPEMLSASPECRITARTGKNLMVTDCQVEHGMSGGPLVETETWRLIGIQIASGNANGQSVSVMIDVRNIPRLLTE
jgi:protease YdgD